jgi:hypothetical protein
MRRLGLALLLLAACEGPAPGTEPLPLADLTRFEAEVQPHLALRCASGGCHGRPERPLSLFAPGAHRLDRERVHLDEPLSRVELEENARRVSAFALTPRARDSLIVRKPLAQAAGGLWHGGGDVFLDDGDPSCRALVAWLDARSIPIDGGAP